MEGPLRAISIYGLFDPRNEELRYIGQTRANLNQRLYQHVSEKSFSHKANWIKILKINGFLPEIFELKKSNELDANIDEELEIAIWKSLGARLTNMLPGGTGLTKDHSETAKERISKTMKRKYIEGTQKGFQLGHKISDSIKKKMSDSHKNNKKEIDRATKVLIDFNKSGMVSKEERLIRSERLKSRYLNNPELFSKMVNASIEKNSKLSKEDLITVYRVLLSGESIRLVSEKYNLGEETVRRIKNKMGKRNKEILGAL